MDDKTEEQDQRKSRVSIMGRSRSTRSQFKSFSRMRMRSHSYGFGSVHGVRPSERGSQLAPEFKRPQLMYLNTYQLSSFKPFDVTLVKAAVEDSLDDHFSDHTYHAQASPALALRVASEILKKVKGMAFNRYRVIAVVSVGQRRAQSFVNAVSFLWDPERDTYVDVHKETPTAFIQMIGNRTTVSKLVNRRHAKIFPIVKESEMDDRQDWRESVGPTFYMPIPRIKRLSE